MGCYETITFKCPNCGEEMSAQSKGGPCDMGCYSHDSVPLDVATDANRHAPFICQCGKAWAFKVPSVINKVYLAIVEVNPGVNPNGR